MTSVPSNLTALAHGIQLAIAPVFLLTAVSGLLGVLASRLGRIIDRARLLESRIDSLEGAPLEEAETELATMFHRNRLINVCLALATTCAVLISCVVAAVFVGELARVDLSIGIAVTFVLGLVAYIGALLVFLREVHVANTTFRVGRHGG